LLEGQEFGAARKSTHSFAVQSDAHFFTTKTTNRCFKIEISQKGKNKSDLYIKLPKKALSAFVFFY